MQNEYDVNARAFVLVSRTRSSDWMPDQVRHDGKRTALQGGLRLWLIRPTGFCRSFRRAWGGFLRVSLTDCLEFRHFRHPTRSEGPVVA